MEILGIGPMEALFIALIALIAVGPRDIGKTARSMGRLLNRLYRSEAWHNLTQASRNLRSLPNRLAREAALEELDQVRRDLKEGIPSSLVPGPAAIDPKPTGKDSGLKHAASTLQPGVSPLNCAGPMVQLRSASRQNEQGTLAARKPPRRANRARQVPAEGARVSLWPS